MTTEIYRQNFTNVATIGDNGFVAVAQRTTVQIGQPRVTGILVFIRNTYPASYNHVVRNMNHLVKQLNTKNKHSMRGGHFFLYRYVILLAIPLCFCFGIASIYVKACAAVSFILSIMYIALSIYNIVIFILNRPLIHPLLTGKIPRGHISGDHMNEFYSVPVNATVLTGIFAAFIDPIIIAAAVQKENIQLTEIQIMLYDDRYLDRSQFPKEIIVHLIVFFILFIFAIIFVSINPSKCNKYEKSFLLLKIVPEQIYM